MCCFSGMLWSFVTTLQDDLWLPNEDLGGRNKRWEPHFRGPLSGCEYSIWATNYWKVNRKSAFHHLFIRPKSSFGDHMIAKDSNMMRCVGFSGMLTLFCNNFGLASVEKCFENAFWNVGSTFQHLLASDVFFVTTWQGWAYKPQQTRARCFDDLRMCSL